MPLAPHTPTVKNKTQNVRQTSARNTASGSSRKSGRLATGKSTRQTTRRQTARAESAERKGQAKKTPLPLVVGVAAVIIILLAVCFSGGQKKKPAPLPDNTPELVGIEKADHLSGEADRLIAAAKKSGSRAEANRSYRKALEDLKAAEKIYEAEELAGNKSVSGKLKKLQEKKFWCKKMQTL